MRSLYTIVAGVLAAGILCLAAARPENEREETIPTAPLPLPHTLPSPVYQDTVYKFLGNRTYAKLGWAHDKGVRNTGPFLMDRDYGTHRSVRIYYSPEVIAWLRNGRAGTIPDGAMIVKEMFVPPAERYDSTASDSLDRLVAGWAVMVRDSIGSKDGWYWIYYGPGQKPDDPRKYPYDYPNSDFGVYCVRCHASAEKEFTFTAGRNIEGFPGEPLTFRVDESWRDDVVDKQGETHERAAESLVPPPAPGPPPSFSIPPLTFDHVLVGPGGPRQFHTSDQCLSCHEGQPPFVPNMFIPVNDTVGINLSPYGEWNWSMMGLAGRDPIFYAQLESELALHSTKKDSVQNLCLSCHGVMGQRQYVADHPGGLFKRDWIDSTRWQSPIASYGGLARDGVSCMVCHQIIDDKLPLDSIFTGRFRTSGPGDQEPGVSYIHGPFEKPSTLAMVASLGMKPVQSTYIKSSRLCASCHTVHLPVYDAKGNQRGSFFEQSTYLEWLNSGYQNELGGGANNPNAKTCQNCHMPTRYPDRDDGAKLAFRIANIQDQTYPEADNRAPLDSITVPWRGDFARHTLLGINIFGLEMFRQFDKMLGVRKKSFMNYSVNGLPFAIKTADQLAKEKTASVKILSVTQGARSLSARVKVTNLAGHRLPSGVGFRRAFMSFEVLDPKGRVIWASGRTDTAGVLVDERERRLPSEFHDIDPATGQQSYQPHYDTVRAQNQAQIYEELIKSPENRFTTSFLSLLTPVKDNRLLPNGWTRSGPPGFRWAHETLPVGNAASDPDFTDGTGSDVVTYVVALPSRLPAGSRIVATLYYQSIPPVYLRDRFATTPNATATKRLRYIVDNLKTKGTPIEGWKLLVARDEVKR